MATPNRDRAGMGFPFRPTVHTLAELFWGFDPRTANADECDLPDTTDFTVTHWDTAADSMTRLDFASVFAGRYQRVWGYIAKMFNFGPTFSMVSKIH